MFAVGLFCPDCGAGNLPVHFMREIELIRRQVESADGLVDNPELAYRLLGNAHEDVLSALETYLKTIYGFLASTAPGAGSRAIGTDLQRIDGIKERFAELGIAPFSILSPDDLAVLRQNVEKRHVVGHNLGIADHKYAKAASAEKVGHTVDLLGTKILNFADIAGSVVLHVAQAARPLRSRPQND